MSFLKRARKMYHPIPFEGYQGFGHVRSDCGERYAAIRECLPPDVSNMSFFDYGCAEGYFLFRLLQNGAKRAVFIDHDECCLQFAEKVANENGLEDYCEFSSFLPVEPCSVGLYLDVHYNGVTPRLEEFKQKCKTLFVSPSGNGNSLQMHRDLNEIYNYVEPIYTGYENRTIFKCIKENQ